MSHESLEERRGLSLLDSLGRWRLAQSIHKWSVKVGLLLESLDRSVVVERWPSVTRSLPYLPLDWCG